MEFLNVGPLELVFILILALLLLGPERMVSATRALGKSIYKLVRSPFWTSVVDTSREIRDLPTKIIREAGLEESIKDIQDINREIGKNAGLKDLNDAAKEIDSRIRQAANLANQEHLKTKSIDPGLRTTLEEPARVGSNKEEEKPEIIPPVEE